MDKLNSSYKPVPCSYCGRLVVTAQHNHGRRIQVNASASDYGNILLTANGWAIRIMDTSRYPKGSLRRAHNCREH